MSKDLIRMKCDRIVVQKSPIFSELLNNRIQKIYQKHIKHLVRKSTICFSHTL